MILLSVLIFAWLVIAILAQNCKKDYSPLRPFDQETSKSLSALLCLGIFLHHSTLYYSNLPIWFYFGPWGGIIVSCFFFKSGYGLALQIKRKGKSYLNNFIKNKIQRIVFPLLFVSAIWQLILNYYSTDSFINSLKGFIAHGNAFCPSTWFLYELIILYILFYFVYSIWEQKKAMLMIWIFTFLLLFIMIKTWGGLYTLSVISFPIGATWLNYEDRICDYIKNNRGISSFLIFCFTVFVLLYGSLGDSVIRCYGWWPLACNTIPMILILLVYMTGLPKSGLLNRFGSLSFEFYLAQGCCITFLYELNGLHSKFLLIPISFTMAVMVGLALRFIFSKVFAF